MAQLNLHTNSEFDAQFGLLMLQKAIPSKSEAIRFAVAAQAKLAQDNDLRRDFSALLGIVKPSQPGRFESDKALWEKDSQHGG